MKKYFVSVFLMLIVINSRGQFSSIQEDYKSLQNTYTPKTVITAGILHGGGSLVGFDLETMLARNIGIQAGAGFVGFGAGLNFHFKPDIRSSFISMQYWHQGVGTSYTQSLIGANYVFRARKIFTFTGGLGFALEKGPAWPAGQEQPPVMLTYAIGVYFPF